MKRRFGIFLALLGLTAGGWAAREEAVRFRDGRYLAVTDHRSQGEQLRLEFETGFILTAVGAVDFIERDGRVVWRRGVGAVNPVTRANPRFQGARPVDVPARARRPLSPRQADGSDE